MATTQTTGAAPKVRLPRWLWVAVVALFVVSFLLRVGLISRHGLWADEFFSLAMATGHSLEHPAAKADPRLGDYVEVPIPLPPSAYSRYLEHEDPAASPGRVIRAVLLSDTSPPLYYLLLYGWTRALGTSDVALRLFSVVCALACFPVIASLARQVGGKAAILPTCLLFVFSPSCVFYSIEGRMYALLLFWTVSTMWLTLRMWRRGVRPGWFFLWLTVGAAGLLTHYFYMFVWAAVCAWVFVQPRRFPRLLLLAGVTLVGLLVLPWYIRVPGLLTNWRVTSTWLNVRPEGYHPVLSLFYLPWSYLAIRGVWGVSAWAEGINLTVYLALAMVAWRKLSWSLFSPWRQFLWWWLLAACLGPAVFDLVRGTYVIRQTRYALTGMPAAFLLVGLVLGRLRPLPQAAFLMLILLGCLVGVSRMYRNLARYGEPTREVGRLLTEQAGPSDVVIVHSIPSGVAGVARYMESGGASGKGIGFASWVGQLRQRRVPEDVQSLVAGYRRVFLVKFHEVGEPASQEAWLRQNATLADDYRLEAVTVLTFVPRGAETFPLLGPETDTADEGRIPTPAPGR